MSRPKFPSDEQDQFMVRMPDGMRDEIAAAAKAAGRSMNSEIVRRLGGDRTPVANITPFGLRMQPGLKTWVEDAARANSRSLNSEITARLEQSIDQTPSHVAPTTLRQWYAGHALGSMQFIFPAPRAAHDPEWMRDQEEAQILEVVNSGAKCAFAIADAMIAFEAKEGEAS